MLKLSQKMDFGSPQKARDLRQVKAAARFHPEEYSRILRTGTERPTPRLGQKTFLR